MCVRNFKDGHYIQCVAFDPNGHYIGTYTTPPDVLDMMLFPSTLQELGLPTVLLEY